MKTNYHTHTPHCGHALGKSTAEYASAAYEAGLDILGFSDHCPFQDLDLGCRMSFDTLPVYIEEVEELQKEYSGRMKILKGAEVEYLPYHCKDGNKFYEYLLKDLKMDYLLLGQHFFWDNNRTLINMYSLPGPEAIVDYAKSCQQALRTGYFNVLAHPDLFGVNDYPWDVNMSRATEIIIESILESNTILEYNANGYRRGIKSFSDGERYMYPLNNFWKEVAQTDIKVIIGSDSHNPLEIWDFAMHKAHEDLKNMGIRFIETI